MLTEVAAVQRTAGALLAALQGTANTRFTGGSLNRGYRVFALNARLNRRRYARYFARISMTASGVQPNSSVARRPMPP